MKKKKSTTIIFTSSKNLCEKLSENLIKNKMSIFKLHSGMDFSSRLITIQILKNSNSKTLVSTDIGSRGLDLSDVKYVINFNFPKIISTYFQRIGRTGRFFKKGYCLSFINQKEIYLLHLFEKHTGLKLKKTNFIKEYEIIKFLLK